MFYGSVPQRFTFWEAKAYCVSHGAELATTAQLYGAWGDGLNHCSPGWLADGSVRYPIVTPRERCGGGEPGVKTIYQYSNQTGFPEIHSRHDVYCFKSKKAILFGGKATVFCKFIPQGTILSLKVKRWLTGQKGNIKNFFF